MSIRNVRLFLPNPIPPSRGPSTDEINPKTVTRSIVGYKQEESDAVLKFLYDHIALGADFHARVKWLPKTVIVWDVRFSPTVFDFRKKRREKH